MSEVREHNPVIDHPFFPTREMNEPRIFYWRKGIIFVTDRRSTNFHMTHFNEPWNIVEEKSFKIGLSWPLFEKIEMYYDGHTIDGFTVLGISITWSYTYNSKSIESKMEKEKQNEPSSH